MGRVCADCQSYQDSTAFSNNQWSKGDGYSRCSGCVGGHCSCSVCGRGFSNSNELKMHMQVHRARNIACPACGDVRFTSGANATQHVESGHCSACPGAANARQQIYKFASQQRALQSYMVDAPRLTYDGNNNYDDVPEFPYNCPSCGKAFRQMSQLLQHQDNKHGNSMRLRLGN